MVSGPVSRTADSHRSKIVVGYDGSEAAAAAVRYAARLAPVLDADLRLVTVWTSPVSAGGYSLSGWPQHREADQFVRIMTHHLFDGETPDWFSAESIEGDPARTLITESADAAMLVVGSRGHGALAGLVLGSVSTDCAAHAACPVLVVRGDSPGHTFTARHLVVAASS